ncbi:MAG: hypothetical protein DRQ99_24400 [Candidatus Parabeggiatoa sp. nov. 3]|nr:MAG: hypothetical protein DRQ99_24400 [Gammaproteobacteria bacterium]
MSLASFAPFVPFAFIFLIEFQTQPFLDIFLLHCYFAILSNSFQIEEDTMTILQRQFINDTQGIPIGVILPLEEYRWIEPMLKQRALLPNSQAHKLKQMEQAVDDTRFMTDLHDVMSDFADVDVEWWETKR